MKPTAALLVLNYNGRHLIEECLPSVIRAAAKAGPGHMVGVVDNASTDGSREMLRRRFPEVRLFEIPENRCIVAYNDAAPLVQQDTLVLLNNDIRVDEDFLPPLLEPFADPQVFAVGARIMDWDGDYLSAGRRHGEIRYGMFHHHSDGGEVETTSRTLFAPCGASAFHRGKFLDLGGIDPLYWPYYYDDVDLSYRAWKRGWTVLYEPRSIMYHRLQATIGKLNTQERIELLDRKNNLLFFWKNITDRRAVLLHHLLLLPRAVKALLLLRFRFLRGLGMALRQWPQARASRRRCLPHARRTDRQILDLCAGPSGNGAGR